VLTFWELKSCLIIIILLITFNYNNHYRNERNSNQTQGYEFDEIWLSESLTKITKYFDINNWIIIVDNNW
jgi:hypothetical protein